MGKVTTKELANGNIGLEITYGGSDAPFGGVDSSAPPAYIDPRCFTQGNGCIIADNKLCALALEPVPIPTLWPGISGVSLIGFGTFYNSIHGQLNYALGYKATPFGTPGVSPTGVNYLFYVTSWEPATLISTTDTLPATLYDSYTLGSSASLTLPCVPSSSRSASTGSGATGSITAISGFGFPTAASLTGGTGYGVGDAVQMVPDGYVPDDYGWLYVTSVGGGGSITGTVFAPNTGFGYVIGPITSGVVEAASSVGVKINGTAYNTVAYGTAVTPGSIVSSLIALINGTDPNVTATASIDGNSLILTALTPGLAGNLIAVQDNSAAELTSAPPPFYFPCVQLTSLAGGLDSSLVPAPRSFTRVSSTSEGGTIYFANLGPLILQYSGIDSLAITTMFQGVSILKKFAGSLIGAGVIPALGFEVQNQDMIFAWSAAGKPTIWNPVDSAGNVTGAGFEQLSDIGEFLSGIIVSNGTAWILRKQGVSCASATGNSTIPFDVNHIGLGEQGEGTQIPSLVTQYDSVGAYVGNTNIWQLTGPITPIGEKIKSAIFKLLQDQTIPASQITSVSSAVFIGGDEYPVAVFIIGTTIFIFNTSNGTWTTLTLNPAITNITQIIGSPIATQNIVQDTGRYGQTEVAVAIQQASGAVSVYSLTENIPDTVTGSTPFSVTFAQEEISFGRDVTIDALYAALQGELQGNVTLNIYISGVLFASVLLTTAVYSSLAPNSLEIQIFPGATGVYTGHSPQLQLQLVNSVGTLNSQLRFSKITMFGSIDPSQRPV